MVEIHIPQVLDYVFPGHSFRYPNFGHSVDWRPEVQSRRLSSLNEWDPVVMKYTGRSTTVQNNLHSNQQKQSCAISDKALADDYAVLSIKASGTSYTRRHCPNPVINHSPPSTSKGTRS